MINFILGMLAMYFLLNLIIIVVLIFAEWERYEMQKQNHFRIAMRLILLLFMAVPFVILEILN